MSRREQRRLEEGEDEEGGASPSAMSLLQDILKLEEIDEGIYRGFTPVFHGLVRVFGGQTIGQALYAAGKTVSDEMTVHSLHSYFLRPGDLHGPILYHVKRIRDGRSFCTRLVQGTQKGQVIFSLLASFHIWEPGYQHQYDMPEVESPDILPSQAEVWQEIIRLHALEVEGKEQQQQAKKQQQNMERSSTGTGQRQRSILDPPEEPTQPLVMKNEDSGKTTVFPRPRHPEPEVQPPPSEISLDPESEKIRQQRATEIASQLPRLPRQVIQYLSLQLKSPFPMEVRPVDDSSFDYLKMDIPRRPPQTARWIRSLGRLGDDPRIHKCAAAFMSDSGFMGTAFLPHGLTWHKIETAASLDHSMWFHRPFRADEWLLFVAESWHSGNALGLSFGRIYDQEGRLVITCAQQGLMRPRSRL